MITMIRPDQTPDDTRRPRGRRLLRPLSAVALALLAGCTPEHGILAPAGEIASRQLSHLGSIFWLMVPVVLPLFLALPLVAWRFRLRGRGKYTPRWDFSWPLEILVWGLPVLIVSILGWRLWTETRDLDPYSQVGPGEPLRIEAIAYDWKWLFIYPDQGVASADLLTLPTDRPVTVEMTSATVMQAFNVPRIGGQIYAMPGMSSEFNLRAAKPGRYEGLNFQYNGEHYAKQHFAVDVVPPEAFDAWVERARAAAPLDDAALDEIGRRGVLPEPKLFGAVPGDPFAETIHRTVLPSKLAAKEKS